MSVDDVAKIVDMMKTAGGWGVAGIFLWLYQNERAYSRALAEKLLTATANSLTLSAAIDSFKTMLRDVWDSVK